MSDAIVYLFFVAEDDKPVAMKLWDDWTARTTAQNANKLGAQVRVVYRSKGDGHLTRVWDNGE